MEIETKVMATRKEKWDGRSRPSNKAYDKGYARIFNPVAKELRTSKFKSKVIKNKKKEKTLHEQLMEGYAEEKRMYEEEEKMNEKDDYFDSKSVKQMMDEMK